MDPFTEAQWVLSCIQHQEGWCCQSVTGAGCEAAATFLAHLKDGFDYASWGRCWGVSCFSWPVRDVSCLFVRRLVWLESPLSTREERVKGTHVKGWQEKNEAEEKGGWICPCETTLPFHTPERAPQTQLVNVKQLTMLWYKLINDTQLAQRGGGEEEERWTHDNKHQEKESKELSDVIK